MSWNCCKEEDITDFRPQLVEEPKLPPKVKPRGTNVPVAYILTHEEDDDEPEQVINQEIKQDQIQDQIQELIQNQLQGLIKDWNREQQGGLGQDDDLAKPSTSDAIDSKERGTQTNPRYFPRSPGRVTLDEILRGMQRIQFIMDNTVTDFEQRISRLERIVLKMRNAWIHHRTCHLQGLEYDDEQGS